MEDGEQSLPQQGIDPISRPSSTSAAEAAVSQLLGMTGGLPEGANSNGESAHDPSLMSATPSQPEHQPEQPHQQPHQQQQQPVTPYNGATPAATAGGNHNGMPTCQNCSTSTTPLWRRDEYGSVLCNACGLFLKLHGRPRPISLKTDVIKSRNRAKVMRPDVQGKKKTPASSQSNATRKPPHADGTTESPISRTGTPSMYTQPLPDFMMDSNPYSGPSFSNGDGSNSPMNGDTPQTAEQLIATNSSLKTRVRELELINELFRGRLSQLEQQEAAARRGNEVAGAEQTQLREQLKQSEETQGQLAAQLEDSHQRERSLKKRLDELELEIEGLRGEPERPAKKQRVESPVPEGEESVRGNPGGDAQVSAESSAAPEPEMAVDTES